MSIIHGFSGHSHSVEGCPRPRSVDLLDRRLGWRAEGRVVGDAVTIAVGGDHARGLAPGRSPSRFGGPRAECLRPRHALGQRAVEYGVGAGRYQLNHAFPMIASAILVGVLAIYAWRVTGKQPLPQG